jgi:thymidine kinase
MPILTHSFPSPDHKFPQAESDHGWLEVIAGPMFADKTGSLIIRYQMNGDSLQAVFKPNLDIRYDKPNALISHNQTSIPACPLPWDKPERILELVQDGTEFVLVDEVQLFTPPIVDVCERLVSKGIYVLVAGLNQDSQGKPFGPMAELMARADELTLLASTCTQCGSLATKTQRLKPSGSAVVIGASELYEPRCRAHFTPVL